MIKGIPHIDESTFKRYRNNEMTDAKRHAFEKELQKNPFEAEALEGFGMFETTDIENDLQELKTQITPPRKNRSSYFAAAATILLLVTAGLVWMQLDKQNPVPQLSERKFKTETNTEAATPQTTINQAQAQKEENTNSGAEQAAISTKEKKKSISPEKSMPPTQSTTQAKPEVRKREKVISISEVMNEVATFEEVQIADEEIALQIIEKDAATVAAPSRAIKSIKFATTPKNKITGKVISTNDQMPIAGVTIVEKGTSNGIITGADGRFEIPLNTDSTSTLIASFIGMQTKEFRPDKNANNIIELRADELALNEVVTIGYGSSKKQDATGNVAEVKTVAKNKEATPLGGFKSYYHYITKKAILPDDCANKKLVVKLQLELDSSGTIVAIRNANMANNEFFDQAKEMVINGPKWQPEYFNARKVKSQVKLRIVFRKPKQ